MQSKIIIPWQLNNLDWGVFLALFVITIGTVALAELRTKKNTASPEESFLDLLLMGRKLTTPMFVATLVATWYGGIFGVTAIAFDKGIYNFVTQGFFWYVTYLLFAFFMVDRIRKFESVTLADMVGQMFGPKSRKLAAIFNFLNVLPIAYAISIGVIVQLTFGIEFENSVIVGVLVVALYSSFGGLRTVVYTDIVQFFVMCTSVIIVLVISISNFGGIDYLKSNLPETHFQLTGDVGLLGTLSWGLIALSTLVDPNFYQRCFAASSTKTAKRGIIYSTIIWFLFDICTTLGAMYAFASIPQAVPNEAYTTYAIQLLPNGLKGLFLAGLFATVLSTLDSYLFIGATNLGYDLPSKKWRRPSFHPLYVSLCALVSIALALQFEGNIASVWKTLGSYSSACLLVPVIFGHLFPGKLRDGQFVLVSISSALIISFWSFPAIDKLYIGCASSVFMIGVCTLFQNFQRDAS